MPSCTAAAGASETRLGLGVAAYPSTTPRWPRGPPLGPDLEERLLLFMGRTAVVLVHRMCVRSLGEPLPAARLDESSEPH